MQIKAQQRLQAASPELQEEAEKVMNWVISFMGKPKKPNFSKTSSTNEGTLMWKKGAFEIFLELQDRAISLDVYFRDTDEELSIQARDSKSLKDKLLKALTKNVDDYKKTYEENTKSIIYLQERLSKLK